MDIGKIVKRETREVPVPTWLPERTPTTPAQPRRETPEREKEPA